MIAKRPPLSRRQWLRLAAAGAAAAIFPSSRPALQATAAGDRDGCVAEGGFTRPLFGRRDEGWFARVAVGGDTMAMRARAVDNGLAFESVVKGRQEFAPTLVA